MENQNFLFDIDEYTEWKKEWQNMPEFIQEDMEPFKTIEIIFEPYWTHNHRDYIQNRMMRVHLRSIEDIHKFGELLKIKGVNLDTKVLKYNIEDFRRIINDQTITDKTKSIYYPYQEPLAAITKRWITDELVLPKYPIYVISKGRWESRLTVKALEKNNIPYHVVIEPQEYKQYSSVIDKDKIYTLPFSNLGRGSIPARNWVWNHAKESGAKRHWIMDDNIDAFGRLHLNMKIRVDSGATIRALEDFVDRYENIAIAGMEYDYFLPRKSKLLPYRLNTRIYSCILLSNEIDYRWRGKYNEDTDLSIRVLKDGLSTILFQAFYCYKTPTLQMKGGNTDHVYIDGDNRLKFAQSLYEQHPDIVQIVERYGRYHHEVNYDSFARNKLIKKNIEIPKQINNYGMKLIELDASGADSLYREDDSDFDE